MCICVSWTKHLEVEARIPIQVINIYMSTINLHASNINVLVILNYLLFLVLTQDFCRLEREGNKEELFKSISFAKFNSLHFRFSC